MVTNLNGSSKDIASAMLEPMSTANASPRSASWANRPAVAVSSPSSREPGRFRPGIILGIHPDQPGRKAIALLGKVHCKVDARDAAIAVGDLRTTSASAGHATKACELGRTPVLIALQ